MVSKFAQLVRYASSVISELKALRRSQDQRKKNLAPSIIDCGRVRVAIARHFGFCFGVENAIDVAFAAIEQNPGRRVFLISEMIHNPRVNDDLRQQGVEFLYDTTGAPLLDRDTLTPDDVVIVPAFGAPLPVLNDLAKRGIAPHTADGTCPFVEKVWRRAEELGKKGYSVVIHGKYTHEETRATFSRAALHAPLVVVKDIDQARQLCTLIADPACSQAAFDKQFGAVSTPGFDVSKHFAALGVVNQTTMLATETAEIMQLVREAVQQRNSRGAPSTFADTRDTLCYATNENQEATDALAAYGREQRALGRQVIGFVVGGHNSSNTSHLVEILETVAPTTFVQGPEGIIDSGRVTHYDFRAKSHRQVINWLYTNGAPGSGVVTVLATCGASCPDSLFEQSLERLLNSVDAYSLAEGYKKFLATQESPL